MAGIVLRASRMIVKQNHANLKVEGLIGSSRVHLQVPKVVVVPKLKRRDGDSVCVACIIDSTHLHTFIIHTYVYYIHKRNAHGYIRERIKGAYYFDACYSVNFLVKFNFRNGLVERLSLNFR